MLRVWQLAQWRFLIMILSVLGIAPSVPAETIFFEAESMQPASDGWKVSRNDQAQRASRVTTLWGADGPGDSVARKSINLTQAGKYRIWVRYMQVGAWRGPFQVDLAADAKPIATRVFDRETLPNVEDWEYTWQSLEAELPAGEVTVSLAKYEQKNCTGYVRHVDCILLTNDLSLVPDHRMYGPQTLIRVTLLEQFERPVYLHFFADHYRSPWYAHYAIGQSGVHEALAPPDGQMLKLGDTTDWCNITPTIYQDSGAALNFSLRHAYHEKAKRFRAKLEFGHADSALSKQIASVKTFDVTAEPNGLVIIVPPNLESKANISLLKRDQEFADEIGKIADAFPWPTYGRHPTKIPFLVTANTSGYELPVDVAITAREQKTLGYFGFNGASERLLHGLWQMQDGSYCRPDIENMRQRVKHDVDVFRKSGRNLDDIAAVMLMDEPTGQPAAFAAQDKGYQDEFRAWLKRKRLTPSDLLVSDWDQVRPVVESDREKFPALHYYTQLFRTRAIGDFMAVQKQLIEQTYGRAIPTLVNFSDGAVYHANFCSQGIDYFELLDSDDQNGIWGEDWANNASTYECAAYNVALMQAAARKRGQTIGHYLIAHAGRTPWDIKTKLTAETARGVRIWQNYYYGPTWGSHEGGPAWKSHLWYRHSQMWQANAELSREIGAVEDWLLTAEPARAKVALLYSSATDIWTMQSNLAFGFDRMHTWLALNHAQIPVDIIPEREIEQLDHYQVCYLSGTHVTRAAAEKLKAWVAAGGTLWLTAGAAQRDEFNRPIDLLGELNSVERGPLESFEPYQNAGKFLSYLNARGTVTWGDQQLEVLSVKQPLKLAKTAMAETKILATFQDQQPAAIVSPVGQGRVYVLGFLPALSYIKPALMARRPLEQQAAADHLAAQQRAAEQLAANADQPLATSAVVSALTTVAAHVGTDREYLDRSHNPWKYPAGIRDCLLTPVRIAGVQTILQCDTPLIDAVALPCQQGTLIALSNHTLQPNKPITLRVKTEQPVKKIESVRQGVLPVTVEEAGVTVLNLKLDANDYVMVTHQK